MRGLAATAVVVACAGASAGNSAIGIPKIIAFTSTSMKPSTTGCLRT